jgi:hypothetical protein
MKDAKLKLHFGYCVENILVRDKGKGRDESTWVVTHLYMEAMLGLSLYSYP